MLSEEHKMFYKCLQWKGNKDILLCVITINESLAYKIKVGSFKSADTVDFIDTQYPILASIERKYIIMDNVFIHKTAIVRESLALRNYVFKNLPLYSPS